MPVSIHRRPLVSTGENQTYQLPGTNDGHVSAKNLHEEQDRFVSVDNTTAVAYIHNVDVVTSDLWMWCLERNINIQAQYLPGS